MVEILGSPVDDSTSKRQQSLLGHPVCQQAFRQLLNIGSQRYARLKKAASEGVRAPLDGRYHSQARAFDSRNSKHLEKRETILEYLEELYQTVSEPLPEANQPNLKRMGGPVDGNLKKKLKTGKTSKPVAAEDSAQPPRFRRHRGRRPKMAAQWNRGADKSQMRLLPPGSFSDYLAVLQTRVPHLKISLKLFSKVTWSFQVPFIFYFCDWFLLSCKFPKLVKRFTRIRCKMSYVLAF